MSSKAIRLSHYSKAKELDESGANSKLQFFDLSIVIAATNNFSFTNKLGRGGFGSVYKVVIINDNLHACFMIVIILIKLTFSLYLNNELVKSIYIYIYILMIVRAYYPMDKK